MLEFQLVLPAYNEAEALPGLIDRVSQAATSAGYSPDRFQLILVENGSTDDSKKVLADLKQGPWGSWFTVEIVPQNRGYGFGLFSGLKRATASVVGWSHADRQCDPADAFKALELLKKAPGLRIIKGRRSQRDPKDAAVSRVFAFLARLFLGLKMNEINAQPKVFHREFIGFLKNPPPGFEFDLYALYKASRAGYGIEEIPVLFPRRPFGASKWAANFIQRYKTIGRMILYMIKLSISEGRV